MARGRVSLKRVAGCGFRNLFRATGSRELQVHPEDHPAEVARPRGTSSSLYGTSTGEGSPPFVKQSFHSSNNVTCLPRVSPTGYPFKIVRWRADPATGVTRERICDVGGLRVAYLAPRGKIGYRCPAEPVDEFVRKGGRLEDTEGRTCLCNALLANIGLGQVRAGGWVEPPLVTSGEDLKSISVFLAGRTRYSAADVIDYLLSKGAG